MQHRGDRSQPWAGLQACGEQPSVTHAWAQMREPWKQAIGVVELGGASLQVTFQTLQHVPVPFTVPLGSADQDSCTLFAHSFNGWGREAAMGRIISGPTSPCFNAGYVSSAGSLLLLAASLSHVLINTTSRFHVFEPRSDSQWWVEKKAEKAVWCLCVNAMLKSKCSSALLPCCLITRKPNA
jgi:hypothetical protein